jgi:hypothetical protein
MFFQESEDAVFHRVETRLAHDGNCQDGTDFWNPDSQRTGEKGFPLGGQVGSRHQGYEKRAAPADDEYNHADAKSKPGLYGLICHLMRFRS